MSIYIKDVELPTDTIKNIMIFSDGQIFQFSGYGNPKPLGTAISVPLHGRLGDLDVLYEKFARLESEAMNALKTTTIGSTEWIKWSAILTERTGYKHDIADALTIIPVDKPKEE